MGTEQPDEFMKKLKKKYDEDPEGWKVTGGKDDDGNQDMFIQHNPDTYWLKRRQINPYQNIMIGSEIRSLDDEINQKCGTPNAQSNLDMLRLFGMAVPVAPDNTIYATGIEKYDNHSANQIRQKIQEKDPNVGKDMNKEIMNAWRKKYRERDGMYG